MFSSAITPQRFWWGHGLDRVCEKRFSSDPCWISTFPTPSLFYHVLNKTSPVAALSGLRASYASPSGNHIHPRQRCFMACRFLNLRLHQQRGTPRSLVMLKVAMCPYQPKGELELVWPRPTNHMCWILPLRLHERCISGDTDL